LEKAHNAVHVHLAPFKGVHLLVRIQLTDKQS